MEKAWLKLELQAESWPPCICPSSSDGSPEVSRSRLAPVLVFTLCWGSDRAPRCNSSNLPWQRSCHPPHTHTPFPPFPYVVRSADSVKTLSQVRKGKRGDRQGCRPQTNQCSSFLSATNWAEGTSLPGRGKPHSIISDPHLALLLYISFLIRPPDFCIYNRHGENSHRLRLGIVVLSPPGRRQDVAAWRHSVKGDAFYCCRRAFKRASLG